MRRRRRDILNKYVYWQFSKTDRIGRVSGVKISQQRNKVRMKATNLRATSPLAETFQWCITSSHPHLLASPPLSSNETVNWQNVQITKVHFCEYPGTERINQCCPQKKLASISVWVAAKHLCLPVIFIHDLHCLSLIHISHISSLAIPVGSYFLQPEDILKNFPRTANLFGQKEFVLMCYKLCQAAFT